MTWRTHSCVPRRDSSRRPPCERRVLTLLMTATLASAQAPRTLTLAEAEAIAMKNHPRVTSALLNARATDAVTKQINAARYPTLASNLTGVGAQNNTSVAAGA